MALYEQVSDEEFAKMASESKSMCEFMYKLGYRSASGSARIPVKKRCDKLGIKIPHHVHIIRNPGQRFPDEIYFQKGVERKGQQVRDRLIRSGYVREECAICGLTNVWNGKHLSLQVDHINGDHFDNRLENLRLLCPNCHSQTETYGGRNLIKNDNG